MRIMIPLMVAVLCFPVTPDIAKRFIHSAQTQYTYLGKILEKHNMIAPDTKAGGGECKIQVGFGWSNGILIT